MGNIYLLNFGIKNVIDGADMDVYPEVDFISLFIVMNN